MRASEPVSCWPHKPCEWRSTRQPATSFMVSVRPTACLNGRVARSKLTMYACGYGSGMEGSGFEPLQRCGIQARRTAALPQISRRENLPVFRCSCSGVRSVSGSRIQRQVFQRPHPERIPLRAGWIRASAYRTPACGSGSNGKNHRRPSAHAAGVSSPTRWMEVSASLGRTAARYSRTGTFSRRQVSNTDRIAATFGAASSLPT